MLKRNDKGRLQLNVMDLKIFLGGLFSHCKSESEVEWLSENIQGAVESLADERLEELGDVD